MVGSGDSDLLSCTILHNWRFYSKYIILLQYITNLIFGTSLAGSLGICVCLEVEEARWVKEHMWSLQKEGLTSCPSKEYGITKYILSALRWNGKVSKEHSSHLPSFLFSPTLPHQSSPMLWYRAEGGPWHSFPGPMGSQLHPGFGTSLSLYPRSHFPLGKKKKIV